MTTKPQLLTRLNRARWQGRDLHSAWMLTEAAGASMVDAVSRTPGVAEGAPSWVIGPRGAALQFNGTNQSIDTGLNASANFPNTTFTVSLWVATTASGGYIVAKLQGGVVNGWAIGVGQVTANKIAVLTKQTGSSTNCVARASQSSITDGAWHHVAAVITTDSSVSGNNSAQIYIDGRLDQASLSVSGVSDGSSSSNIFIGKRNGGGYLACSIDEIRIYPRALSANEIKELYEAPLAIWLPHRRRRTSVAVAADLASAATVSVLGAGVLSVSVAFSTAAVAGALGSGSMQSVQALGGAGVVAAAGAGALTVAMPIAAAALAAAVGSGNLDSGGAADLSGVGLATAGGGASVSVSLNLSSAAVAGAIAQAAAGMSIGLAGSATAGAAGVGSMLMTVPLIGAATARGIGSGDLDVGAAADLAGAAASITLAGGTMTVSLRLDAAAVLRAIGQGTLSGGSPVAVFVDGSPRVFREAPRPRVWH